MCWLQVSRNIQKQQQQAADSTSNNSTFMADTNGSINNRMLINAAVNGVGFNGEVRSVSNTVMCIFALVVAPLYSDPFSILYTDRFII